MACMAQANQKKLTQAPLVIFIVSVSFLSVRPLNILLHERAALIVVSRLKKINKMIPHNRFNNVQCTDGDFSLGNQIALPIKDTPVLKGRDAIRFIKRMHEADSKCNVACIEGRKIFPYDDRSD
jgi:hypothetical protein